MNDWGDEPAADEEQKKLRLRQAPKHPGTPESAPFESVEDRRLAADRQLDIMNKEEGGGPPTAEMRRLSESVPGSKIAQGVSQFTGDEPVVEEPWTPIDPVAEDDQWTPVDPVAKASWWDHIAAVPGTITGILKETAGGAARFVGETDDWTTVPGMIKGSMEAGRKLGQKFAGTEGGPTVSESLVESGEYLYQAGKREAEAAMPAGETPNDPSTADFWKRMVTLGLANVGVQGLPLAAGVLTRNPVIPLATAGAMAYMQEYGEQREAGIGVGESRVRSALIGTTEMLTEFFPAKWLTQMVPGKVLKTLAAALVTDMGGELAQTTIQSVNAKYSTNPDMTFDEYLQALLDTAGATAIATPLMGVGAVGISRLPGVRQERKPPEAVEGPVNAPLTDPNIDLDTLDEDSAAISAGIAEIDALDTASIGERELEESRRIVEEFDAAKKAKPLPQADVHWPQLSTAPTDVVDIAEMGATSRQAGNAENYVNPNVGDRLERTFSLSTEPSMVGLKPNQILPVPGVHVLGQPTPDRPVELLQALMETAEPLRKKYMPDAVLVISNEQLYSDSALGWHHLAGQKQHLIVPAVLRKAKDLKAFNVNTQAGVFYNFFHEFGHALFFERLLEGIAPELSSQMIRESRVGVITEEAIARIADPAVQGVIREYNERKARIMDDTMTAQEFADTWLGPAKRARKYLEELKVAPNDSANAVMRAVVRRAVTESRITNEMSKKQMTEKLTQDFFSLEEYFAEQAARNAYRTKQDQMTPLGKLLEKGLASLRALFSDLKAALVIAPGVKFAEWMDGLSQAARLGEEKHHVAKSKENAGKKAKEAKPVKVAKKPAAKAKPKVKRVAHNVLTEDSVVERQKKLKGIIATMLRKGDIERGDGVHTELVDLIERKQWAEITEILQDIGVKGVKWEIDPAEIPDGAVKKPGGTWDPELIEELAKPLSRSVYRGLRGGDIEQSSKTIANWSRSAIRNYLNKYAGTARDPLKDLEIPMLGEPWGKFWASAISSTPAKSFGNTGPLAHLPPDTPVWWAEFGRDTHHGLTSFISHVGDYLSRVPLKDLPRYGLVQAVQETLANDKNVAMAAERAARASIGQLPTYKAYPDGYQWVEYVLPKKLTEAQMKLVRKAGKNELISMIRGDEGPHGIDPEESMRGDEEGWVALDQEGKPIRNEYTSEIAGGPTPEEAWLAGHLAQEGNIMGHCVGGACGIIVNKTGQILSLRDEKGQPHVTVEIGQEVWDPEAVGLDTVMERLTQEEKGQVFRDVGPMPDGFEQRLNHGGLIDADFAWWHTAAAHPLYKGVVDSLTKPVPGKPPEILQIKGKENKRPIDKYQPYITDLVKSEAWGKVEDLQNTDLKKIGEIYYTKEEVARITEEKVIQQKGFETPEFKAWFGDWWDNPEGASVARVGIWGDPGPDWLSKKDPLADSGLNVNRKVPAPPVVVFMTLARLKAGEDTFHASTPRGTDYLESVLPEVAGDQAKVPVVLNIRNPYVVQDAQIDRPMKSELIQQGYDGLVYRNDLNDHVTYVVFKLDQIKIVGSRSPYDRASGVSLETDFDASTPEGSMAGKFLSGLKNFLGDEAGGLRIALRTTTEGMARWFLAIPQVAHLNQWIEPLQYYAAQASEYIRDRQGLIEESDKIVTEWGNLSAHNTTLLNEVLMKEMEGKEHWFKMVAFKKKIPEAVDPVTWWRYELSQRAIDEYKKLGVDPLDGGKGQMITALALRVKNDGLNLINEAEWRSAILLRMKYGANPNVVRHAASRNKKLFEGIRSTPFFYKARFGNLMLIIREKRAKGQGYDTVYQQHFTNQGEWLKAYNRARERALPHQEVIHRKVTDDEYVMLNVPSELIDTLASEFDLDPAQVAKLQEILMPAKQERVLNQFETQRLGVPGYSRDAMRAYAHWSSHFSSQISKLKYRKKLNGAIRDMDKMIELGEQGKPSASETGLPGTEHELGIATTSKLRNIRRMMAESRDYVMNPPTEWQATRAAVSVAYLFGNVATASINFFGLVTTLYNSIRKHGHFKGEQLFLNAVYNAASMTTLRSLSTLKKGDFLDPKLQALFERAVKEGITEQSYAYNLAGVANNHLAWRFRTLKPGMVAWRKLIDLGMLPFRFTEIQTRRTTLMLSLAEQLADKTSGTEIKYQNAVRETEILQGDYTLAGKVKVMRGTRGALGGALPLVTVFMTFAQLMMFNTLGGTELGHRRAIQEQIRRGELPSSAKMSTISWSYGYTARLWLVFFMMAGYLGMPLMENILDLIGPLWRMLGGKKPIRQELREVVKSVVGEEYVMMLSRGMMHNVFGYDLSRKVSVGRVLPGTESVASEVPKTFEGQVGDMALDLLGVPGSVLRFASGFYSKPWDEAMLRAPGGVGNMWTAYHWSQNGVRGPNDAEMSWEIDPETGRRKVRSLTGMDLFMKGLGANPSDVSQKREEEYGAYEVSQFWLSKRKGILDQWDKAMVQQDEGMKQAVKMAIVEFNKTLRDAGKEYYPLQITPKDMSTREKQRRKAQIRTERGISSGRSGPVQRKFKESFGKDQ